MAKRDRGTGTLYRPKGSSNWSIQYYLHGVRQRESTSTNNKMQAKKFLQDRLAAVATGNFMGAEIDKVTVGEIVENFLDSPDKRCSKAWDDDSRRWHNHLKATFEHVRASRLSTAMVNSYILQRQMEPMNLAVRAAKGKDYKMTSRQSSKLPSSGTINREVSLLRAAYNYAYKSDPPKVMRIPHFEFLPESEPRKGFLPDDKFDDLAAACAAEGLWLRAALELWATYGWRQREPLDLMTVSQCDFPARMIRLEPGTTKNGDGRNVPMTQKVFDLLSALCEGKAQDALVFTYADGSGIKNFRKTWQNVCEEAGCAGLHVHDLRRTGARNMRRMGIHEGTIMRIGGWKTRSVFDRYNIVDESDLRDAVRRMDQHQQQREAEREAEREANSEQEKSEFSHSLAIVAVKSSQHEKSEVAN